jgi:hypothetical protein
MSDLFHKQVPRQFIDQVFDTMEGAEWHVFQVLTKRSSLMRDYLRKRYGAARGPSHIWRGVSVEDRQATARISHLRGCAAGVRFLSIEPLIGAVGPINLKGIDWVIAGGESGPGARPIRLEWLREVRDQCIDQGVAFFFKQWGGLRPKSGGRELDGRVWNDFPSTLGAPTSARHPSRALGQAEAERLPSPQSGSILAATDARKLGGRMTTHYEWKVGEPLPLLGEHSVAKHDIFEQYVGIYIERLTRRPSQTIFNLTIVDGFSGGGLYRLGSGVVDGSPLRLLRAVEAADQALKATRAKGFAVRADFFFVDENAEHIAFLRDLLARRGYG